MYITVTLIGSLTSPEVSGSRPPPCSSFSLTMIDEDQAVMFGGKVAGTGRSAGLHILHLPTMVGLLIPLFRLNTL